MRYAAFAAIFATATAGAVPSSAAAQSIVDFSKPQTGKARFVLNPDLTPADLGATEEKPAPALAAARVPACGEGCKMEQPELPQEARTYYSRESGYYRSGNGTRVIFVGNLGAGAQKVTQPALAPRKTFRFRRR